MDFFMNLITQYGIEAMFFLILIEYACFPISSEIVLPFSGAVASSQNTDYLVILCLSVIAGLIGTSLCFAVGKYGGNVIITKIQKRFPKSEKSFSSCYEKFQKHGSSAVCISRVIPLCRTYIAFVAGAMNLKYSTFLIASFAGISVWNALLIGLGFVLGTKWGLVKTYYQEYKHIFLIIIILLIIIFLCKKFFQRNKKPKN